MDLSKRKKSFEEMLSSCGYIVYTNVGVIMMPLIRQRRDVIEIRPLSGRAHKYDVVLYNSRGEYILHQVLKVRPNDYVFCDDHNVYPQYAITDDMILGIIKRVI